MNDQQMHELLVKLQVVAADAYLQEEDGDLKTARLLLKNHLLSATLASGAIADGV